MRRSLHSMLRRIRRTLAGASHRTGESAGCSISSNAAVFERTTILVRSFYVLTFALGIELLSAFTERIEADGAEPLLLAGWMRWLPPEQGIAWVSALLIGGAIVAALDPSIRFARIATFVGLLVLLAARFSVGKIDHGFHFWLWTSAVFCLFPGRPRESETGRASKRQIHLLVFFGAQMAVALFFSISGVWKLAAGCYQLAIGEVNLFSPSAMARQVADQFIATHRLTRAGELVVEHPPLGWLPYLVAIYLEIFSIVAVFRPRLHRIWGVGLLLFQLGTRLVLDVWSPWGIAAVGLLFVASPFAIPASSWRDQIRALPAIGDALVLLQDRSTVRSSRR